MVSPSFVAFKRAIKRQSLNLLDYLGFYQIGFILVFHWFFIGFFFFVFGLFLFNFGFSLVFHWFLS